MDANFRMELQYDGTGLHGWAKQPGLTTVEGCLEEALTAVLGTSVSLRVAGRTDAGVHARQQVVSMRLPSTTDPLRLTASLNALTPQGIAIRRIARVADAFDARRDATSRVYRYFLSTAKVPSPFWSRYCWEVGHHLDEDSLHEAANVTVGKHDFTGFTPAVSEHSHFRRTVKDCKWRPVRGESGLLRLEIEADSFLRHMVRALVGTMVEVAEGKRELKGYRALLSGTEREAGGITAPSQGLFLWRIEYRGSRSASSLPISDEVAEEADE